MADVYLFVSAAAANSRVALVSTDTETFRIETYSAGDLLISNYTLLTGDISKLLSLWDKDADRTLALTPTLNLSTNGDAFTFTNGSTLADADVASDEIALTVAQTGAMISWLRSGFANP
jgi:hypothetical protein